MPSCTEEEFPVGAQCCRKCSPGHRVKEACGETTGTVCAPCSPGTYTAHLNGLDECLPCRVCDPDTGLVTRRKCSSTGNTVCGCDRGHFCVLVDGDNCAECGPHSDCRPGQRVQETGTEWQDTVCEDCPPGTFSAGAGHGVTQTHVHPEPPSLGPGSSLPLCEPGCAAGTLAGPCEHQATREPMPATQVPTAPVPQVQQPL